MFAEFIYKKWVSTQNDVTCTYAMVPVCYIPHNPYTLHYNPYPAYSDPYKKPGQLGELSG